MFNKGKGKVRYGKDEVYREAGKAKITSIV